MPPTRYDPERHHRRSIRMKGHDYAGGGTYFVTICAHRDAGDIFAPTPVRKMIARIWHAMPQSPAVGAVLVAAQGTHEGCEEGTHEGCGKEGTHEGCPYVIMPDHFHALVRLRAKAPVPLGDVVGAFKSLVVHEYIAGVNAGRLAPFPARIWHRNYYESIVRTPESERRIAGYIRMNPWKLVQHATHEGQSFRMIGNPALLNREKIAVLCSRNCPRSVLAAAAKRADKAEPRHCFVSGFHSPPEKTILAALLKSEACIVCCPAWGVDTMRIPLEWLPALEANRMLILEMVERAGNLASAEARNRFVLECAEERWLPYMDPGGMLARLTSAIRTSSQKPSSRHHVHSGTHPAPNQ